MEEESKPVDIVLQVDDLNVDMETFIDMMFKKVKVEVEEDGQTAG